MTNSISREWNAGDMSETRKRTLEKSDSIPTEEIILGPQDEKTENIEG